MRNLLALVGLIVIVVLGLGFYLGWFNLSSRSDAGKPSVTLSVDEDKILADKDKVVSNVHDLGRKAEDKVTPTTRNAQE